MSLYIWLKQDAEEKLRSLQAQGRLANGRIETDDATGSKYFPVYKNLLEATAVMKTLPADLIERVTWQDMIHRGFLPDGIYRHEGAEMLVETDIHHDYTNAYDFSGIEQIVRQVRQEINVTAPTFESLRTLYTLARSKKLQPEELWSDDPIYCNFVQDPDPDDDNDQFEE